MYRSSLKYLNDNYEEKETQYQHCFLFCIFLLLSFVLFNFVSVRRQRVMNKMQLCRDNQIMELFKKPNKYLYTNYDANIFPFKGERK